MKTKHDAMMEYFRPKVEELAGQLPGFNFSSADPDAVAFITSYSDKIRKKYIRAAEKEYGFTIIINKPYSGSMDNANLEAMNFAQSFMDWLDEQNKTGNYPCFPGNCQIRKMENLQNMPNLADVNLQEGLARYMIQCRVIYFEKE